VADVLEEGLASVTSPGRLEIIGTEPTVIVDAAHNPHGAASLVEALGTYFAFDEFCVVLGVLQDKDARGIVEALAPVAERFHVTQSQSDRAVDYVELAELVLEATHEDATYQFETVEHAINDARAWAAEAPGRAVVVTGSITLVGEAIALAAAEGWK
jgi:dihydrofolate synthase/folylpolyglutamate synthase